MRYKELLERKVALAGEIRRQADKIHAENRDFTAEERAGWDKANADYNEIESRVAAEKRLAELNGSRAGGVPRTDLGGFTGDSSTRERDRSLALQAWVNKPVPGFVRTDEHIEAARRVGFNLDATEINLGLTPTAEYKRFQRQYNSTPGSERLGLRIGATAMSVGTNSAGGYSVPTELMNRIEVNMLYFGPMRQVADVFRTPTGDTLNWTTGDDTGNTGAQISEGATVATGTSVAPTIAQIQFLAYKFSSQLVAVSSELLQDSAFDVAATVGDLLGERLGRIGNTKQTTGAGHGSTTPEGIVTGSAVGKTAALTTAFTADELIDLYHSVDIAYRPGATWMMHDLIAAYVRKFKDSTGQYLWQPGLEDGRPDRMLGCNVNINNDMSAALTTGQKLVLFGNMSKFKIRDAGGLRIVRLNELLADTDQVGFICYQRMDSRLMTAGTNPVKRLILA